MEQTYDVKLFERLHHRLSPTMAAQRLYPQTVYLLDSFDRMEGSLHNWDENGVLRVGSTVTLGSTLLPQLARCFQAEHPGVSLQVQVANGQTITEALCENRLDLALQENVVSLPELHCEELGADRLCAVLAADHPLAALCAQDGRLCLRPIQGLDLARRRVLVWHKEKFFTPLMQQFAELCRQKANG